MVCLSLDEVQKSGNTEPCCSKAGGVTQRGARQLPSCQSFFFLALGVDSMMCSPCEIHRAIHLRLWTFLLYARCTTIKLSKMKGEKYSLRYLLAQISPFSSCLQTGGEKNGRLVCESKGKRERGKKIKSVLSLKAGKRSKTQKEKEVILHPPVVIGMKLSFRN